MYLASAEISPDFHGGFALGNCEWLATVIALRKTAGANVLQLAHRPFWGPYPYAVGIRASLGCCQPYYHGTKFAHTIKGPWIPRAVECTVPFVGPLLISQANAYVHSNRVSSRKPVIVALCMLQHVQSVVFLINLSRPTFNFCTHYTCPIAFLNDNANKHREAASMKPSRLGFRRLRNSCDICTLSKLKCSREKPVCQRCVDRGCQQDCNYSVARRPGRRRQTSVISDEVGSYGTDNAVDAARVKRGTAPLTPSSILADSLLPTERRDSTRSTPQQNDTRDGKARTTLLSPGMASIEAFTNISMELPHDADTVDFGSIDDLSLWEWGTNGVDPHCTNGHHSDSVEQMWDLASSQDMLSGTKFGAGSIAGEPTQEPSPPMSQIGRQNTYQDDQTPLTHVTGFPEDPISSGATASDLLFDLSKDVDCQCSSQLSQLIYLVSLRLAKPTTLDVFFAVEQQLNRTKDTISTCAQCSFNSPYVSMMFCTSISWVIEHLQTYIRESNSVSALNSQATYLTISGLTLSKEMSHSCFEALVKLRLRRVVQTARELAVLNIQTKSTLSDGMRSAAVDTGAAAQQMFGMLEMRGAS